MSRRAHPLSAAATSLVVVVTLAAPLALGGTRWGVQLALAAPALLAGLLLGLSRIQDGLRLPWPVWIPWLLVLAGLIQLVHLPAPLLATLSPVAAHLREAAGDPSGPITLSTAATWIAVAHQAAFAAVLTVAMQLEGRRRRWLMNGLLAAGLLVALIGALHFALGAQIILWRFPAQDEPILRGYFSTFVNNNTLAGFLCLTGLTALGTSASAEGEGRARFALAVAVTSLLGALASGSRGGQAAALVGALIFVGLAYTRGIHRQDPTRQKTRRLALAVILLLLPGLIAAVLLMPEWLTLDLTRPESDGKLAAWPGAAAHARAFWLTGSGRGSFEFVHPLFQSVEGRGTVTHPENHLLQLTSEWGLILGSLTVIAFVGAWIKALRIVGRRTQPERWGLLAGLAAAGLQQLFDFGLEAAGLSLPLAVALGIALSPAERSQGETRAPRGPSLALAALCAALLGLLALKGPAALAEHPNQDAAAVARAPDWRAAAAAAAARHPADGLIPLNAALRAAADGAPLPELLGWINRTLRLAPKDHRPHLLAARALLAADRPRQAATEYRLTAEKAPWRWLPLARELSQRLSDPADLLRALPERPRALWAVGNPLLTAGHADRARALADLRLAESPDDDAAHDVRGRACLTLGDAPCVEAEIRWLTAHDQAPLAWALRGRLALAAGDPAAARAALQELSDPKADERSLNAAFSLAERLGDLPAARALYDRLFRRLGSRPEAARALLLRRARTEERLGTPADALRAWQRIHTLSPDDRSAEGLARAQARLEAAPPAPALAPPPPGVKPTAPP